MTAARTPARRRVGLIGMGFIGRELWRRICSQPELGLDLAFVHNRSPEALADDALRQALLAQARQAGTTLAVPHGALMGLDSLYEWREAWDEVTIRFDKHPNNIDFSDSGLSPGPYDKADVQARGRDGPLLSLRKEQPAIGVSGTEMVASQFGSILRAAGRMETLAFV